MTARPDTRGLFDPKWYARRHGLMGEDTAWQHFREHRKSHGLDPNPLFDSRWYRATYLGTTSVDPLDHFLRSKPADAISPSPFFESHWYLENNADVRGAGLDPYRHYFECGRYEGRLPNSWCDPAYEGCRTFDPDLSLAFGVEDLLGYIPHYTTLDRLISGADVASFFSPERPCWIFAKVRAPNERFGVGADVVLLGGAREQFSGVSVRIPDENVARAGCYRAFRVRYAVSPIIRNALSALGCDASSRECVTSLMDRIAQAVARRPDVPPSKINLVIDTMSAPLMRRQLADSLMASINIVTMDPGYLCRVQLL